MIDTNTTVYIRERGKEKEYTRKILINKCLAFFFFFFFYIFFVLSNFT